MSGDERPDPRLQAALRHAPDADVQAPPAVGERLRAAAREAIRADRVAPWWRRLLSTTPLRLGASGAFASLLLAGVIGLLWRGEPTPVEPAPDTPPAAPSSTPAPRTEARDDRARAPADAVPSNKVLRAPPEAADTARVNAGPSAEVASAPAAAAQTPPAPAAPAFAEATATSPAVSSPSVVTGTQGARRFAAPAPPSTTRAADAWRRELDRVAGERWRALEGEPPPTMRRIGNADVALDGTRVVLCEGVPPRCREATLDADEARQLATTLPP